MAEISTIARPYAKGLFQALADRHASSAEMNSVLAAMKDIQQALGTPELSGMVGDPRLQLGQMLELIHSVKAESETPKEVNNLLSLVLSNGRIFAWSEIVEQFHKLINDSEGIAEVHIESAFAISKEDVESLLASLAHRFSNKKFISTVTVNPDLIGGVCIRVGDQVLDGSIRARLNQMKTALTA